MLKHLFSTVFFFFLLVCYVSFASAACIVQLKNGQKVEGNFKGATSHEIHVEVASQILKFKIDEVSHIIFDNKFFSKEHSNNLTPISFKSSAKKALRSVKAIQSLIRAGVTYRDYSSKVNDSKIIVDEFLDEYNDSKHEDFNRLIGNAIGFYNAASLAWSSKITKNEQIYYSIPTNEYCLKCKQLQNTLINLENGKYKVGGRDEGLAISYFGIQPLWECAGAAISAADKLLDN